MLLAEVLALELAERQQIEMLELERRTGRDRRLVRMGGAERQDEDGQGEGQRAHHAKSSKGW